MGWRVKVPGSAALRPSGTLTETGALGARIRAFFGAPAEAEFGERSSAQSSLTFTGRRSESGLRRGAGGDPLSNSFSEGPPPPAPVRHLRPEMERSTRGQVQRRGWGTAVWFVVRSPKPSGSGAEGGSVRRRKRWSPPSFPPSGGSEGEGGPAGGLRPSGVGSGAVGPSSPGGAVVSRCAFLGVGRMVYAFGRSFPTLGEHTGEHSQPLGAGNGHSLRPAAEPITVARVWEELRVGVKS